MYQPYLSRMVVFLVVVLTISIFLYSFFLLEAVAHAAAMTTAEARVQTISGQLSTLEGQYLSLTQSLTPQKAAALGFVTPLNLETVYAKGESGSLSFQSK